MVLPHSVPREFLKAKSLREDSPLLTQQLKAEDWQCLIALVWSFVKEERRTVDPHVRRALPSYQECLLTAEIWVPLHLKRSRKIAANSFMRNISEQRRMGIFYHPQISYRIANYEKRGMNYNSASAYSSGPWCPLTLISNMWYRPGKEGKKGENKKEKCSMSVW